MNNLVRHALHLLTGQPLPPRCTACRHRIWGGNWSDTSSPTPRHWHPECGPPAADEPARTTPNNPTTSSKD